MDDRHFDDLTKFVGRRASRRAVVKGAAAAALAAVIGRATRGDNAAEAAIYQQGGVKQRVRVYCNQAGQKCKDSKNPTRRCCFRCNGSLNNANSRCCEDEGFACIQDSHCCNGLICRDPNLSDGVNLKGCFVSGELQPGSECLGGAESATSTCESGECCDFENACILDSYDPNNNQCCDAYVETCTNEGCCPIEQACPSLFGLGACCDPYTETCEFSPTFGDYFCIPNT
jgi:hypothetical protein